MTIRSEEIMRLLTKKGNILDSLKKIDNQMTSVHSKNMKELRRRKKRFESKLKKIDEEIITLKKPRKRIENNELEYEQEDVQTAKKTDKKPLLEMTNERADRNKELEKDVKEIDDPDEVAASENSLDKEKTPDKKEHLNVKSQKKKSSIFLWMKDLFKSPQIKNKKKGEKRSAKKELTYLLAAIFVISLSLLMFEIALTRIFSVMFTYHYAFLAISLALFGLGMGGIFLHIVSPKIRSKAKGFKFLVISSIFYSMSLLVLTLLMISIPFSDNIMIYYSLMFVPFFIAGSIFALVFKMNVIHSRMIYSVNLIGAGLGCLIVVLFLDGIGGINTIIGIGVISSIGALFFAVASKKKKAIGSSLVVLILISALFLQNITYSFFNDVPIGNDPNKDLSRLMNIYEFDIIDTRWSAFGRTDLVKDRNESNQDEMYMYIDGASGTGMYRFNGNINDPNNTVVQQIPRSFGAFFPFLFPKVDNVLIIGPGGGRDVLIALMGGAEHITAVEVNQDIVDLMEEYSWYNGGIYTDFDNVHIVVDEGRSYLKRSKEKYDIILLSIPITKTSGSVGGYSLSENYLFTIDAFEDYFDHLSEDGRLVVIPHEMNEVYKLTSIMLSMFQKRGISEEEAMYHLVVAGPGGHHGVLGVMFPAFIVRKTAYTSFEAKARHDLAMQVGYQHVYVPYISQNMVDEHLYHWESGEMEFERCMASRPVDMRAPTDDSPFFYKFEKGIPESLSSIMGYAVLITLAVLIVPAIYRIFIYKKYVSKIRNKRKRLERRKKYLINRSKSKKNRAKLETLGQISLAKFVLYFSILGFVFMVIEISLFQKFILFLGHPTLSLSVLLFSLLISGGLGSLSSHFIKEESLLKKVSMISIIIPIIIIIYIIMLPFIFNVFLSSEMFIRALISGILIFPLGFLMGIPFPSGISLMRRSYKKDIPWMWGINGTFSVLGSAFAIVIAMSSGFTSGLISGALGYFVIFLIFR
jgi:predicted membrane-bound spermidine synthase